MRRTRGLNVRVCRLIMPMLRKNLTIAIVVLLPLLLAGCKQGQDIEIPFLPGFGPHKIEVQQGNVVTQEMIEKLQPGMTRNQVRFVLGTPLLVDPFRSDRWDYVYVLSQKGARIEQRQLKVYFKDDKMLRYEGDLPLDKPLLDAAGKPVPRPAAKPVVAPIVSPEPEKPVAATPTPAPPVGDPKLRLVPSEGQPATPEERAAAASAAKPAPGAPGQEPQVLDAPPMPRIQLSPEQPETPVQAEKPGAPKP